jgi:hypothetical protein
VSDPIPLQEIANLVEASEIWNILECGICGKPDREDFCMRRVKERDFACKHCKNPGLGLLTFNEPRRSRHAIPTMIRAGHFNRYEAFA